MVAIADAVSRGFLILRREFDLSNVGVLVTGLVP
jgi:hypothetical protein